MREKNKPKNVYNPNDVPLRSSLRGKTGDVPMRSSLKGKRQSSSEMKKDVNSPGQEKRLSFVKKGIIDDLTYKTFDKPIRKSEVQRAKTKIGEKFNMKDTLKKARYFINENMENVLKEITKLEKEEDKITKLLNPGPKKRPTIYSNGEE